MANQIQNTEPREASTPEVETVDLLDVALILASNLRKLIVLPLLLGVMALGLSSLVEPTFTGRALIIPPQQQSSAAAALQGLGALTGIAGAAAGLRNQSDQYAALMQSARVTNRLVERFELMRLYESRFLEDARRQLEKNSRIAASRKDGFISIEVDDPSPERAAALANAYIEELEALTKQLAVTEAQQRRAFFESQLETTKARFSEAQRRLQAAGFSEGAIRAEPRAAAENYARLRAEVTAAEVRLHSMRSYLAESSSEYQIARAQLAALRTQLARVESVSGSAADDDYISRYREFKYQETLFELFMRQFELAKLDESREGPLIQVVDRATPPERKSKPRRALIAVVTTLVAGVLVVFWVFARAALTAAQANASSAGRLRELSDAFRRAVGLRSTNAS